MFSRKRLAYIIIITIIFSGLFFLFNLDHDFLRSQEKNQADSFVPSPKVSATLSNLSLDPGVLVIGLPKEKSETLIKANVVSALTEIKIRFTLVDSLTSTDLINKEILIFVVADVSKVADLQLVAEYIQKGGKAIFAAGIPTDADWRYLDPVWGIQERGSFSTTTDITFNKGYFPYESLTIKDGFPSYSMTLRVQEPSEVMLEGPNQNPLVWTHDYGLGRSTMINGTFMESKLSLGILVAALSNTKELALYPILGTKTVFLDAIPPLFDGNDENSFEYYGRSAESFVRDKLWAVLLQKASLMNLKLTSSFFAIDKQNFESQNANQQTFSFISRQIIQNGGEITLSGNHVDLDQLESARVQVTKTFFNQFFPNYNLHAYYPLYGKIDETQINTIKSVYPSIDILRLLYDGDETTQSTGDFEVREDLVIYPTTTYGYKAEGTQLYTFLSILTSHGAISHSFDINSLFTVPSSESNWNTLNKSFDILSDLYFGKTDWLEAVTISPAVERLKDQSGLTVNSHTETNTLSVACLNMAPGQKFMFYSKNKILSAVGATYREISRNYYLIEASAAAFTLTY